MQKSLFNSSPYPFSCNSISNSKPLIFLSSINRSESKIQKLVGMIFLSLCFAAKATSSLKGRTVWIIVTGFVAISLTATAVYTAQKIMKKYAANTKEKPPGIIPKENKTNTKNPGVGLSSDKSQESKIRQGNPVIKTETPENLSSKTLTEEENKNTSSIPENQKEEIECFTMIPNENEEYSTRIFDTKHLQTFIYLPSIPQTLRSLVSNYVTIRKANLNKSNLSLPQIASPSIHGLKKIAVHYKMKYGIKIKVCSPKNLGQLLKTLKEKKEITGVIIEGGDEDLKTRHVIPMLCDFSQGRIDVITLDVLGKEGSKSLPLYQAIKKECATQNLNYQSSIEPRQADTESCRTESLVVLRNALIDIQQNQKEKKGIGHDRLLVGPKNKFIMPLEWDYHNQITNRYLSEKSTAKIRRHELSKDPSKRNKIQTVQEFRASHAKKVKTRLTLTLNGYHLSTGRCETLKKGSTVVEELLKLDPGTPPAFKIESNLSILPKPIDEKKVEVSIIWEDEQVFNTYQVTKGHKYRKKFTNPSLKREEEQ